MVITDPTKQLTAFQLAYLTAAIWSSTDDNGDPLDEKYAIIDINPQTIDQMITDCDKFTADNAADLEGENMSLAGHDFWLTRNGHGAGFWDGDWEKSKGERLTEASKKFGECDLYVGDDGKIYIF